MEYGEVFTRLTYETAIVAFFKKDGSVRLMLCTRNLKTVALEHGNLKGLLEGHDKRCNIKNGNVAVIDLILGEGRAFNIKRVISISWLGEIVTQEQYDEALHKFKEVKEKFESKYNNGLSLDLLT